MHLNGVMSKELESRITVQTVFELVCVRNFLSVGDIALNQSLRNLSKREYSKHLLRYHINSGCKLFLSMYTLMIILTMHLSA